MRSLRRRTGDSAYGLRGRLPDFLIIGATKSGTTSLADWLRDHSQVFIPARKEVRFFNEQWLRGIEWYRQQFARARPDQLAGDATPAYLSDPVVPDRIHSVLPDVKLVVILRNPVDRAYSHYWLRRGYKAETRSFADAVRAEQNGAPDAYPYLAEGRYLPQLQRFARTFGKDAMLMLVFEDLKNEPIATFVRCCEFLGIDRSESPASVGTVSNAAVRIRSARLWETMLANEWHDKLPPRLWKLLYDANRAPLTYTAMDPALRAELTDDFAVPNRELGTWLGAALPWNTSTTNARRRYGPSRG